MGSLPFFLKEAMRALRRNAAPSIAATVTVAVTVLLIGVLVPIIFVANDKTGDIRDQIGLKVFLAEGVGKPEIKAVEERLLGTAHVESVDFVSKREAIKIVGERVGRRNPIADLNRNPLPASFFVKPDDPDNVEVIQRALEPVDAAGRPVPFSPAIDEINSSRDEALPIREATGGLQIWLVIIVLMLGFTSLLLVGNTIRLSIYTRRRDIEVMRLVGATSSFIRWPFVIEGVLVGLFGAIIAGFFLFLGKVIVSDPLSQNFKFIEDLASPAFVPLMIALTVGAMAISALGSGVTLRRFLRV